MNAANNQALRELQGSRSSNRSFLSGPSNNDASERPKQFSKTVKRMHVPNTVLSGPSTSHRQNTAVRSVVDTSPKVPLKSALKQTKMTRFSDRPTVHPIPAWSKRARRSKHTDGGMYDPDYEAIITIEPSSEEPSPAQDQDIVQEDAETETLSEVGAIDTDDTPGEPVSDELAAPQVDIIPPVPILADVNGPIEPSSPPAEVTSSPPRTPATVDVSHPLTEESHLASPLTEASHPGSALTEEPLPPTEVPPVTPSTSASTSTATSPAESRCHSCESTDEGCTRDVTKKLLRSAEKRVYKAMKAVTTQSRQPLGVLPRGKFKQLMVAHGYKNWSNVKIATHKVPELQPATGEPRKVKTPKIHVKRQRYQLSTDSDDPDAEPDPDYTPRR